MYKGNNGSMIKQAVRGLQSQSEFCSICGDTIVKTRGQVCSGCAAKVQRRMHCIKEHGIVTRIIKGGQSACVQNSIVVHQGRGCGGCRFEKTGG